MFCILLKHQNQNKCFKKYDSFIDNRILKFDKGKNTHEKNYFKIDYKTLYITVLFYKDGFNNCLKASDSPYYVLNFILSTPY